MWKIRTTSKQSVPPGLLRGARSLGVQLDDQLLLDRHVDLCAFRELVDQHTHPVDQDLHPGRHSALPVSLTGDDERGHLLGLLPHVNHVVRAHAVGGDVDPSIVDQEVAVHDELPGVSPGPRETGAVHDVVQAGLENLQQDVAGLTLLAVGFLVVTAELLVEDAVTLPRLLLLVQLVAVLALLLPDAAVLARRVGATLVRLVAADEVDAETTGLLGDGTGVTGHDGSALLWSRGLRRGDASADDSRCAPAGSHRRSNRPPDRSPAVSGSRSRGRTPGP